METFLQIIGGLVLLAVGGEFVVRGAVGAARKLGVSELMIGLTLVGFGTSAPELITSINAALSGSPAIAIGNVVGSNISNVLLIFALVVLAKPVPVDPKAVSRDGWIMVFATIALIAAANLTGEVSRLTGFIFFAALVSYIAFSYVAERKGGPTAELHEDEGEALPPTKPPPLMLSLGFLLGGLIGLIFGADFLVAGARTLALAAGLSETVIGLTVVALGTSLPELVASLAAALKGRSALAFGAIVGSNIYNILGIIGITAMVSPITIPPDLIARDWVALYGAALLLLLHAGTGGLVKRKEGAFLLCHYGLYAWLLLS